MSYKLIALYLDDSPWMRATLALTAEIAVAQGAHVTGMTAGEGGSASSVGPCQVFSEFMRRAGVASYDTTRLEGDPAASLSLSGRYSDLIVLGRRPEDDAGFAAHVDFCEFVAINSACAVMVAAHGLQPSGLPRHALVAWDGSHVAARAVRAALPLLHAARRTTIALINAPPEPATAALGPGAAMARYLLHHGIHADVVRQTVDTDAGHALLALAGARQHDLMVLGSTAHPLFNDVLHQGATRTVLQSGRLAALLYR